jgi:hypothetical protein
MKESGWGFGMLAEWVPVRLRRLVNYINICVCNIYILKLFLPTNAHFIEHIKC